MGKKEDKVKKDIIEKHDIFYDMTNAMDREDLKSELSRLANYKEEVEFAKDNDTELNELKESVKFISGPYNDAVKVLKLKTAYIHLLLRDLGYQSGQEDEAAKEG